MLRHIRGGAAAKGKTMKHMTPAFMAEVTGGKLFAPEAIKDCEITAVTTDSRQVEEGGLFIPLKGARFDGHDYIPQVMEKGARLVLTEREDTTRQYPCIYVESTEKALRRLAKAYLDIMAVPVIAITGSVGKTSTKEMIASVLSQKYRTLKTLGNFNNELGLPLTIFRLRDGDEAAVLEMGISHFGDMTVLAEIANPDISIITNIGTCHLENLIDRDGVFRAKTEVFDYLRDGGRVILNGDDDKLLAVAAVKGKAPIFFGLGKNHEYYADAITSRGLRGISCRIHTPDSEFSVAIPVPGEHSVYNALAGCAVGRLMKLTDEEIRQGIESVESLAGRFHIIEKNGLTIIDDCYNANPMSMKASLNVLYQAEGRRVAILGDMAELGHDEEDLHRSVGRHMVDKTPEVLLTAGPLTEKMAEEVKNADVTCDIISYPNTEALALDVKNHIKKGDTILVKASHCMNFDKITQALSD